MRRSEPARLGAGAVVSLLLHSAAVLALGVAPPIWSERPPAHDAAKPRVRPGIERSRSATINWLGFETPTPHQAPQNAIDPPQMAVDPAPQASAQPPAPAPAPPPSAAQAEDAAQASAPSATPSPSPPAPGNAREPTNLLDAQTPAQAPLGDVPLFDPAQFVGPPAPTTLRPTQEPPQAPNQSPSDGANTASEASSDAQSNSAPATPGGTPASAPDKDADASSRDKPIKVELGKPIAAEGVDIATIRPRWTLYTRMTASPRNPLVEVVFGPDGRVKHARVIETSGRSDVDGPLLDAVYNWRAKGQAIDALNAPGATTRSVSFRFRIGLR